ncbi:MAG: hypothetical protein BWZ02_02369 [Lentisphaerae bacterium ADurb.BinA184]|nr:MAG: hypothetical protein BWZ02_02369 [Lentisphaerae bacterium ADurb.BinA184]
MIAARQRTGQLDRAPGAAAAQLAGPRGDCLRGDGAAVDGQFIQPRAEADHAAGHELHVAPQHRVAQNMTDGLIQRTELAEQDVVTVAVRKGAVVSDPDDVFAGAAVIVVVGVQQVDAVDHHLLAEVECGNAQTQVGGGGAGPQELVAGAIVGSVHDAGAVALQDGTSRHRLAQRTDTADRIGDGDQPHGVGRGRGVRQRRGLCVGLHTQRCAMDDRAGEGADGLVGDTVDQHLAQPGAEGAGWIG